MGMAINNNDHRPRRASWNQLGGGSLSMKSSLSSLSSSMTSRPRSTASSMPASRRKSASWTFASKERSDNTAISTSRQSSRSASWTFASRELASDNNHIKQSTTYLRSNSRDTTRSSRSSSLSSLLSIPDDTQEDDLWAEFKNELEARHLKTGLGVQGMLSKFVAEKKQKQLKEEEAARRLLEEEEKKNLTSASVTANNRRNPLHHLRSSFTLKSLVSMDEIDQKQQKEERDPSWMLPLPGRRGSENSENEASRTNNNNLQGTKDCRYTSDKIEEKWLNSHYHSSCTSDVGNMVIRGISRDYLDKNVDESGSEQRNKIQMPNLDKYHSRENKNDLAKVENRKRLSHINHSSCPSVVEQITTAVSTTTSRISSSSSNKKGERSADYLTQRNSWSYNIMARKPTDSCSSEIRKVVDSSSRTRGDRISGYWDTRNSWTPSSLPTSNDNNNATAQRTRKPMLQDWFRSVGERGFTRKLPTAVSSGVTKDNDKGSNHQKQMESVASHYVYSELDHIQRIAAQCPNYSFWGHGDDHDEEEEYSDNDASDKISDQSFPPDLTPPPPDELSSREVPVSKNKGNHHKLQKKTTSVLCSKDELTDCNQSQPSCLKPPLPRLEEPSSLEVKAPSLSKTSSKRISDDCEDKDNNPGTKNLLHLLFSMDEEEVTQAKRPPPSPSVDDLPAENETQSNRDREEDLEEKRLMERVAELQQTIASLDLSPEISPASLPSGIKPATPDFYQPRRKHDRNDKTNSMSSTAATIAAAAADRESKDRLRQAWYPRGRNDIGNNQLSSMTWSSNDRNHAPMDQNVGRVTNLTRSMPSILPSMSNQNDSPRTPEQMPRANSFLSVMSMLSAGGKRDTRQGKVHRMPAAYPKRIEATTGRRHSEGVPLGNLNQQQQQHQIDNAAPYRQANNVQSRPGITTTRNTFEHDRIHTDAEKQHIDWATGNMSLLSNDGNAAAMDQHVDNSMTNLARSMPSILPSMSNQNKSPTPETRPRGNSLVSVMSILSTGSKRDIRRCKVRRMSASDPKQSEATVSSEYQGALMDTLSHRLQQQNQRQQIGSTVPYRQASNVQSRPGGTTRNTFEQHRLPTVAEKQHSDWVTGNGVFLNPLPSSDDINCEEALMKLSCLKKQHIKRKNQDRASNDNRNNDTMINSISFTEEHMKKSSTMNEKDEIIGEAPCTTGSSSSQGGRTDAISSNTSHEPPSLNNHGTLPAFRRRGSIALDTISTGQLLVDWGDTTGCEEDESEHGNDNNKSGMPNDCVEPCVLKNEEEGGEETAIWPCGVNQSLEDHFITLYHQDKALRRISDITTEAFDNHEVIDSYQEEVEELSTPNTFRQKFRSLYIKEEPGEEKSDR